MSIYQEAEEKLARLLGWTNIVKGAYGMWGKPVTSESIMSSPLPHWTQDDAAAFKLMVEHALDIEVYSLGVYAVWVDNRDIYSHVKFTDFSDKLLATRYAIVLTVIDKLEGNK